MSSIIISADQSAVGRMIAKQAAAVLGYDLVGQEILEEVAERYKVPKDRLVESLDETVSSWTLPAMTRNRNLAYVQAAALERFLQDNLVCEGLAAHLFVREISHVLMIRVLSDLRVRANKIAAERNIAPKRARRALERQEKRRRRWSMDAFGLDETNPSLYDMVITLSHIEPDRAVKIIADTVGDRKFQPMTYSKKCIQDMALASRVQVALIGRFPDVKVRARDGTVMVQIKKIAPNWRKKAESIKKLAQQVTGVEYVEVHRNIDFFGQAGTSSQ